MNLNHWKEKFSQKTDDELKAISVSNSHQEIVRIAATELLLDRGILTDMDNPQMPELLSKKNDLQYLLNRLSDYGYHVNYTSEQRFKITSSTDAKITALVLFFLGVIIFSFCLFPIIINYLNNQTIVIGRGFWLIATSIGMIGTGWYRYFNAHGYRVEVANDQIMIEGYIGDGETFEHKHSIEKIDHFHMETIELNDNEGSIEYHFKIKMKDGSVIHFLNIHERLSKMTKEYAEFLLIALNQLLSA